MHNFELLEILAIGFSLALIFGFLTHKLNLSPIVGYLLAGFLVGPYSPVFVADAELAGQLAEVGVLLLMFGVGLHFDLKDLMAVGRIAVFGAIAQSSIATLLGLAVAYAYGLSMMAGLVLGIGLSVASTVVLMRVLLDNNMLDTVHGHVAVGWLIVEDIITVLVLVLLPAFAAITRHEDTGGNMLTALGMAVFKITLLWILVLPVGGRIVTWLLSHVARSRSTELFTLTVLVLAFVIATGSAVIFGASVALGAFLAGMVVGRTKVSHQAAADILPMRDAFSVLFFISVGMLFDPKFIVSQRGLVIACLGVILIAKPLTASIVVTLLGYSVRTGLTVALGLAQIGEFSFILAQQAMDLGLMPKEAYSVLVACALITISMNPILFRSLIPLEKSLQRRPRIWKLLSGRSDRKALQTNLQTRRLLDESGHGSHAIVVGYGPVGQRVASILREFEVKPVIIDLNVDTINSLVADGHLAVYGDASRRKILEEAGIARAKYLLITLPDLPAAVGTVSTALDLNPEIRILVRARYLGAQPILEELGVTTISFEEEEVAKAMTEVLLESMKAEPEV